MWPPTVLGSISGKFLIDAKSDLPPETRGDFMNHKVYTPKKYT